MCIVRGDNYMLWISKIKKRKFQMMLIGLIVMISSFMLSSSIGIVTSVTAPMDTLIKKTKAPILFMTEDKYDGIQNDMSSAKKTLEADKRVIKVNIIKDVIKAGGKIKYGTKEMDIPTAYFMSYKNGDFGEPKFIKGGTKLKKGECYINSILAETYNISLNDCIVVENPQKNINLKVKGIYADPYNVSMTFGIDKFYINNEQIKEIYGVNQEMLTVFSKDYNSAEYVIKQYKKRSTKQLSLKIQNLDTAKLSAEISQQMVGSFIAAFALIILLVSAIVIRSSIFDSIVKEYKNIGVYKSLGYSSRSIINIYLKAYSAVVLIAAVIGSVFSKYLIMYTLSNSFNVYGVKAETSDIKPMMLTVIFVMLLMLTSIYGIIRKTKEISPVEALTLGVPLNKKRGASLKFMEDKFFPCAQALRKIINYKKLTVILFLILFVCSYLVSFSITIYISLSTISDKSSFWFGFDNAKYRISVNDVSREKKVYKWIKNNKKVKGSVEGNLEYPAVLSNDEIEDDGSILLTSYKQFDKNGIKENVLEGRNPKYDNEIAVSKKLLEKTHKSLGDYIDIYIKGQKKTLLITGCYQSMMHLGMIARVLESTIQSSDKEYFITNISFNLINPHDYKNVKNDAENRFDKAILINKSNNYFKDNLKGISNSSKAAIAPFTLLLIIIGAINVFSIIMLMNINNKREFCIYKSIGYSTIDLIKTNCVYVTILGSFAAILELPVFYFSYPIIMDMIFSMFGIYKYPIDIRFKLLVFGLLFSMATYLASTLISSLSIRKFKVQELNED